MYRYIERLKKLLILVPIIDFSVLLQNNINGRISIIYFVETDVLPDTGMCV